MLSLLPETKIRVVGPTFATDLTAPITHQHEFAGYDWFGNLFEAHVDPGENTEPLWRIDALTGEPLIVGESHTVLCRKKGEARYLRRSVKDIQYEGVPVYVRMPQRKIASDRILFDNLQADEKSIHIVPPTARDLLPIMEAGATAGIGVNRRKGELRVDLEKNRPVCFATKLINGNFEENLEGTLEELIGGAIICPSGRFDDQYIEKTAKTGVIFEGWTFFNDVLIVPPRPLGKNGLVHHIRKVDDVPVELTWFCT